eukprot:TRINITY_DN4334_c0_g1_i1.p1 TRINITY_DN4334_c0_g1~~TRINITY_DN4334_c0_g1_i1.p1  ORF type:complete len:521 (+),score=118.68 TRINITY_DN4334_c0_g1_i1:88-1563(+)
MERIIVERDFMDGKYRGETKGPSRHGNGVMRYYTGDVYDGEWKMDKWDGEGSFIWKSGDRYVGTFKDMKRNGKGKLIYSNGSSFEGEFIDDRVEGDGVYRWNNGDVYEGSFKDGKRHGGGTMTYHDGFRCTSKWDNNVEQGLFRSPSSPVTVLPGIERDLEKGLDSKERRQLIAQFTAKTEEDEESFAYQKANEMLSNDLVSKIQKEYPNIQLSAKALFLTNQFVSGVVQSLFDEMSRSEKVKISGDMVTSSIMSLLGVHALDTESKVTVFSNYYGIIDQTLAKVDLLSSTTNGWIPVKKTEEIEIFKKDMEDTAIQCLKGEAIFNFTPKRIANFIKNYENLRLWDPLIQEVTVVEDIDNHSQILHLKYGAKVCFLTQKRDFVVLRYWQERNDGSFVVVAKSIVHKKVPKLDDYVRGEALCTGYVITPHENGSQVIYLAHINLIGLDGGKLATESFKTKFVNMIQQTHPTNILRIKELLSRYDNQSKIAAS